MLVFVILETYTNPTPYNPRITFLKARMSISPISLIVHGGAGSWRPGSESDAMASMSAAVLVGRKILEAGGSALDAFR